ncbi:sensor histidine kinase [Geomesophilobacter sediminis]|uniref:histidine kinase n=1 Tax=Geomesophilobacter sediminis TaxID=2798584 RepID=A0A8J7JJY6_9BACT|nr:sensor histidine kinase [Geomesophilobacter sediminis]MBJ6723395.1 PAS domain S-box protein [Geomesophilobacter sediminis]
MFTDDTSLSDRLDDAQRRLASCEARCRNILRGCVFGVVFLGREGGLRYANPAAEAILGPAPAPGELEALLAALPKGELPLSRGEETVWLEVTGSRSEWEGGEAWFVTLADITARRRAAAELATSQERLEHALDAAGMGSCDMDAASGEGVWTRQHFLILGYPDPQQRSAPASMAQWQQLIVGEDRGRVGWELEQARRDGAPFHSEHRIRRLQNGEPLWVSVNGRFVQSGAGARFIGVIFDISQRRRAEEELRRSELHYRLLFETVPQGIVFQDAQGRITSMNPAAEAIVGRSASELVGKRAEELEIVVLHPDGSPLPVAEHPSLRALRGALSVPGVEMWVHNRRENAYRYLVVTAVPQFRPGEAAPFQVYTMLQDVTEQKRAKERLVESESRFRWLFESDLIAIYFWDTEGRITEANQAFCSMLGYSRDECRAGRMTWHEVTDPESHPADERALHEMERHRFCPPYEKVFLSPKDGRRVPALVAAALMAGSQTEGIAYAVDLTELKRVEEALRRSETTLKLAIEATGLGTYDYNPETGTLHWSEIARRHYQVPAGAETDFDFFIGRVHPDDRPRIAELVRRALLPEQGGAFDAIYRIVVDGKERILSARGKTTFDEQGRAVRMVGTCLDVTEILQTEKSLKEETARRLLAVEELQRQERLLLDQSRLAAMGEMLGNIAHQWRQPLNTLALIIQEVPRFYQGGLFSKRYLDQSVARAMQVISSLSQMIDGFRSFIQPDVERVPFAAAVEVARAVALAEAAFDLLRNRILVDVDPQAVIVGYPNEYSQVILNILANAKDAFVERQVSQPVVRIRLFREGGRVVLTIADNAGGIPNEIIGRIFDPYFTTKGPTQGTGIGLFMSKTIVERHMDGTLRARNLADGAEFRIEV